MPSNNESQCYFVQLQIDGFLDGDLDAAQQAVFVAHVQSCAACASEFHFAQTVHDAVLELPPLECDDAVLAPIARLPEAEGRAPDSPRGDAFWSQLAGLLLSTPRYFRYGFSVAVVSLLAVAIGLSVSTPVDSPQQLATNGAVQQYTAEDISEALQELNVAIDYLNRLSQRTEVMIGERFLVDPLQDSINASLLKAGLRESDELPGGPI